MHRLSSDNLNYFVAKRVSGCKGIVRSAGPESTVVVPETYFHATSELVAILILLCWALTLVFHPEVILNNPLNTRAG